MASVDSSAMSPSVISNLTGGRLNASIAVLVTAAAQCGSALPIAGQDVVGQCEQRVALGTRRKRVEGLFGAFGEFRRAAIRVVERAMLFEGIEKLFPLSWYDGPAADDVAHDP